MARRLASGCPGPSSIPRRSWGRRRPRVVVDGGVALRVEKPPNHVRRMRACKKIRMGVKRGRGVSVCSPESEEKPASGGGWSSSSSSGLGALGLGFLGAEERRREGFLWAQTR